MGRVLVLRAHPGFGATVEGEALVFHDPINFTSDIDPETGRCVAKGHDLCGQVVAGKVLVSPTPKGGSGSAIALPFLAEKGVAPRALLYERTIPVVLQGAIMGSIPIMDRFRRPPASVIRTGDYLRVDPAKGQVEVLRRGRP